MAVKRTTEMQYSLSTAFREEPAATSGNTIRHQPRTLTREGAEVTFTVTQVQLKDEENGVTIQLDMHDWLDIAEDVRKHIERN